MKKLAYRVTTLKEIASAIDKSKPLAIDIETDGFYGEVLLSQFYQSDWSEALLVPKPDLFFLAGLLSDTHMICHNVSYEVSTIQEQLGKAIGEAIGEKLHYWAPATWDDTLLLSKLQYWKKEKFALDNCYTYLLGVDPYLVYELDKKEMQKTDWSVLTEDKLKYAAIDVFYLLDLYDACSSQLEKPYYQLDKAATTHAFKLQTNGLPIDIERIKAKIAENNLAVQEAAIPINVNSYMQVRPYIGETESDGLALATFALKGNDKAREVQRVRKIIKETSFLQKYLDTAVEERIYGKFTFTTKSGRANCKDQNLQQLPRTTKGMFSAPSGKVFVLSDFAQLELRYMCAVANDAKMTRMFREGLDMHSFVAELMSVPRQQAKTCNFNLGYGGSANMLRSIFITEVDTLLPLSTVTKLKTEWHKLWTEITAWQKQMTKDWKAKRPAVTVLGRKMSAKLYTDAMNLPIQGGSAEVAKLALHKMVKKVVLDPELAYKAKLVNFVHDSYMWEVDDDPAIYKKLAALVAESMREAWFELIKYTPVPDLPMPVEVIVGSNWGDLERGIEEPIHTYNIN